VLYLIDFSKINFNNKEPVYIQIANFIKRQILLGNIESGDELPSRRELATLLGINPNTVQKAYRMMESEGYVVTVGNTGSVVLVDEKVHAAIENELTKGMVDDFVRSAKALNMSFKRVIDLISEVWDEV
jgi:GntR family transcriptional regulator